MLARLAQAGFLALMVARAAQGKDCERACELFASVSRKYLVHEAKVSCKKHNVSPRPTTEDICLSTYRALTHSACLNFCDQSPLIDDACGAIAGTTWIPKHNAFRACKTGYKMAAQTVPKLVEQAAEASDELHSLLGGEEDENEQVHKSAEIKVGGADAGAEEGAEEEFLEEEFEFPITVDDGSVMSLIVSNKDDVSAKVSAFCAEHVASEPACLDQLLPIVKERMEVE